jgi:hypothetical protein
MTILSLAASTNLDGDDLGSVLPDVRWSHGGGEIVAAILCKKLKGGGCERQVLARMNTSGYLVLSHSADPYIYGVGRFLGQTAPSTASKYLASKRHLGNTSPPSITH